MRAVNIQGEVFGRLTAVRNTDLRRFHSVVWECQCVCGTTTLATVSKLRAGNVQSCGCLQKEKAGLVGMAYGASNMWKLRQKSGTQTKHKKAGGTNRAKALLRKLTGSLLLVLLLVGVAEAKQHKPGDTWQKGDGCNTCQMDKFGKSSCTVMYCYDSSSVGGVVLTCEQKMKETMLEIDEIVRLNYGLLMDRDPGQPRICLNLSQHAYRQWERTMKECVK